MPTYDRAFNPPAPAFEIIIQHPDDPTRTVSVTAQIDTAADLSCIPLTKVAALGLERGDETIIAGYDGRPAANLLYLVTLRINGFAINRVRAIAIPDSVFLLGRNVLNHFNLTLRGKDETFDIVDP